MRLAALLLTACSLAAKNPFEPLDPGFRVEANDGVHGSDRAVQAHRAPCGAVGTWIEQPLSDVCIPCIAPDADLFARLAQGHPREIQIPLKRPGDPAAPHAFQKTFGRN